MQKMSKTQRYQQELGTALDAARRRILLLHVPKLRSPASPSPGIINLKIDTKLL